MDAEQHDVEPLAADELALRGAILLDVREPEEFEAGHAPAARLIPLGLLEARLGEIGADADVVCVCRTGIRSAEAAELLRRRGVRARNLLGGMKAWAADGLPVESTGGASGTIL